MKLQDLLLMRHELTLIFVTLIIFLTEIFVSDKRKSIVIPLSLVLMTIATIIGFIPAASGSLFGGMYVVDPIRLMIKNILNFGVLIILFQAVEWVKHERNRPRLSEFYILLFSTLIGMSYMISSGHFLMLYLGLELATIPAAALAAYDRHKTISAEAGIKLIFNSAISSGIFLYGLSVIYGVSGSLYFTEVAANFSFSTLSTLGLIFFITGMGFKMSLVPFHLWTADVYEGAPISVTSFLSVISKGASAFVFTFVLFQVFGKFTEIWSVAIYALAVVTMIIGNLFALRQDNFKRFLAFSSIAQAGFILLGILSADQFGMATVVYFILVYIVTNLAALGVVSAVYNASGKENISDYNGLYKSNPKLSLLITLAMFSLAGIPPVAGFFSKFFLFAAASSKGYYYLVFIAVINTTISLYYYLLPVKAVFINKNDSPIPFFKTDNYTKASLVLCALALFAFGIASYIFELIQSLSVGLA